MSLKQTEAEEKRSDPSRHIVGDNSIAIEQHGHLHGFHIPVRPANEAGQEELFRRADEAFARLRAESGMSEDELTAMLDLSLPDAQEDATISTGGSRDAPDTY